MKVRIIQPYISAQALFAHQIRGLARFSAQLGPMVLAALTPEEFETEVVNEHIEELDYDTPVDIVAITTLTANVTRAYRIADKYRAKGVTVVLGGIHASLMPEEAIHHCDAVLVGEAEYVWQKLLEDWQNGKLDRFYQSNSLTDMVDVPIPRRELDLTVGFTDKIESSRGCPFDCDFCSTNLHFGRQFRTRPVEGLMKDIESIHRHKVHTLMFADDNIVGKHKHASRVFEALVGMGFGWVSQSSIDIAEDSRLLELAAKSGCLSLSLGFESLSASNLKDSLKLHNQVKKYDEQIKRIQGVGIKILANFVYGFDGDDKSVFERTVEFVERHKMDAYFTILTPYPRTRLRERLMEEGRILHSDWSLYDTVHCVIRPKLMEPEEMEEGLRWAYQQIYPGKELLIEDPKSLHKEYRLSELSKLILGLWRKNGKTDASAKKMKAFLGDAVFDIKLRTKLYLGSKDIWTQTNHDLNDDEIKMLREILATERLGHLLALERELAPDLLRKYRGAGLLRSIIDAVTVSSTGSRARG